MLDGDKSLRIGFNNLTLDESLGLKRAQCGFKLANSRGGGDGCPPL
jgi:hypothetical protein